MNRTVAIGLLGVVAIVLAVGLTFWQNASEEKTSDKAEQAPSNVPERTTELKSAAGSTVAAKDATALAKPPDRKGAIKPAKLIAPSFDIVRVNSEGDAVIAGRAEPGATVTVFYGKTVIGTVEADRKGEWVLVPTKPLPSGDRALSVSAKNENGDELKSKDVVILAVPETQKPGEKPLAVLVPLKGLATKKVLQKPRVPAEEPSISLSLEVVDYDESGRMRLSGYANPGNTTLVYINNASIGRTTVTKNGTWELLPANPVSPGIYTLRVDEVKETKVVARIELPFARAEPLKALANEEYVIVQPGNSLWRISRRILGEGTMYTVIYEANKDQIRDADLIYPGQIFAVPRKN